MTTTKYRVRKIQKKRQDHQVFIDNLRILEKLRREMEFFSRPPLYHVPDVEFVPYEPPKRPWWRFW